MKGISISAAQSLCNKSGNLTWKASEVRSTESLNLDTHVGIGCMGVVACREAVRCIDMLCDFQCIINGLGY